MQRRRIIPLAIVVLAVAACSSDRATTSASASARSAAAKRSATPTTTELPGKEIHATSKSAGSPRIGEPICDAEKHCMYPLSGTETYAGDLTGTAISHGAGALVGTKYAAGNTAIFTGTVAGCGKGTLVVIGSGVGTSNGPGTGKWEIAEGLGTGDLVRVRGSGTNTFATNSDGTLAGTLTGHVTCD